jgi:long-chain acyl-CoA synthetase
MDITALVARLPEQKAHSIISFENGRVVRRTHADVYADVQAARDRLMAWGLKAGMRVGIRAPNSYQWIIYDLALIQMRAVSVAFTDDFAQMGAEELCEKYSLSLIFVTAKEGSRDPEKSPFIVYIEGNNNGARVIDRGIPTDDESFDRPGLIFSSGSTGGLRGLVLNRKGIEESVDSFTQVIAPREDDSVLLFLPISNFQQRLIYYSALWYGFDIIVTDTSRLFRALKELHPTIFIAPPTLYEAFETRFSNLPKWKQLIAQIAGGVALKLPIKSARQKVAQLLFKEVYKTLGSRMRFMVTGMAPIKRSTLDLFARMQLPLFETYGLIEFGSVALNVPKAHKVGSVGKPLPGVQIEIAEDGEIIAHREHMQTHGYFDCAEGESEKTFIGNNRVATGDIGRFDDDGYLYLIGRKKEIIITGGGKKVHPEVLEAEINACMDVARSVLFGSQGAPSLVAVVLPKNPKDAGAQGRIQQFVEQFNKRQPSMTVGEIVFTDLEFSRENGFLRPNLKLDRKKIEQHFQAEISAFAAKPGKI